MPTHLRALAVIAFLSLLVFALARPVACMRAIEPADFKRRAMTWCAITLLAFLSHDYWIFVLLSVPLLVIASRRDPNPVAFYLFLVFAVPPFRVDIPGFGVFDYIVSVDHTRWMALAVLVPAAARLRTMPGTMPFGRLTVDKFLIAYILLWIGLRFSEAPVTHLVRIAFNMTVDVALPYYVAGRGLRDLKAFRDAIMSFAVAALLMALVAMFEFGRYWLLYSGLERVLGLPAWGLGNYLARGEAWLLRAQVTTGHPIVLGYVMAVALVLYMYLRPLVPSGRYWLGALALAGGLVAGMSRGPWVGAVAGLLLLLVTGPQIGSKVVRGALLGLLALPIVLTTDAGQKMIDYLPFVGTVEKQNVELRQRLFEVSLGVIAQNPLFGSFAPQPGMEEMRGSDGIIDVVNTYVLVALRGGVVGLALFAAPFLIVGAGIAHTLYAMRDKASEYHLLGRALLAALVAIAVTIGTVSPISMVPVVYMVMIGLGTGYLRLDPRGLTAPEPARRAPALRRPSPRPGRA